MTILTERPRERCLESGPSCLSLRECLAVLLGSGPPGQGSLGLAEALLKTVGAQDFDPSELEYAFFSALDAHPRYSFNEISGIGEASHARILVALEIAKRYAEFQARRKSRQTERSKGREDIRSLAFEQIPSKFRHDSHEWLGFVPVYSSNRLGKLCVIEHGVKTHVNFDPIELFARVLALRPRAFFLFHNHPSGALTPSQADLDLTFRVGSLTKDLGLAFLGHGIVSAFGNRWIGV